MTWKHAWLSNTSSNETDTEADKTVRNSLFQTIRMFLEASPKAARIGFAYAKECVEEFAGISKGGI